MKASHVKFNIGCLIIELEQYSGSHMAEMNYGELLFYYPIFYLFPDIIYITIIIKISCH